MPQRPPPAPPSIPFKHVCGDMFRVPVADLTPRHDGDWTVYEAVCPTCGGTAEARV